METSQDIPGPQMELLALTPAVIARGQLGCASVPVCMYVCVRACVWMHTQGWELGGTLALGTQTSPILLLGLLA